MTVAAVSTVRNEADIIEASVRHLLAEGVDLVLIADGRSQDGTTQILHRLHEETRGRVEVIEDYKDFHDQPYWIDTLARIAHHRGHEWIIPFDADEFWYPSDLSQSLRSALEALPPHIPVTLVPMYQQRDWYHKEIDPKPLPKVAYRWSPHAKIGPGNHRVEGLDHHPIAYGVLSLREIQYRGFEHFCRKVVERNATIDPSLGEEFGFHHKRFDGLGRYEMLKAWEKLNEPEVIWDPIPSHLPGPFDEVPHENRSIRELFEQQLIGWSDIRGHLQRLHDLVVELDAKQVLELGVNTGVSTIALLAGVERTNGQCHSCELARPRPRPEVWSHPRWHLRIGDDLGLVDRHREVLGTVDLLFVDTSHTYRQTVAELKAYVDLVRPGGAIALHDCCEYPDQQRAQNHFTRWIEEKGRPIMKREHYTHDNGLSILWL